MLTEKMIRRLIMDSDLREHRTRCLSQSALSRATEHDVLGEPSSRAIEEEDENSGDGDVAGSAYAVYSAGPVLMRRLAVGAGAKWTSRRSTHDYLS